MKKSVLISYCLCAVLSVATYKNYMIYFVIPLSLVITLEKEYFGELNGLSMGLMKYAKLKIELWLVHWLLSFSFMVMCTCLVPSTVS